MKKPIPAAFCVALFSLSIIAANAQTILFSHPGKTYVNTDSLKTDVFGPVSLNGCTKVSMTLDYAFSLPYPGSGNLESSDECIPVMGPCLGDPNQPSAGGCIYCWDFLLVLYQLDGVTVDSTLVGVPGNTVQAATISTGQIPTNNASACTIIVKTISWASNEGVTYNNIKVLCHAVSDAPDLTNKPDRLILSPNPASDMVKIYTSGGASGLIKMTMVNTMGQEVMRRNVQLDENIPVGDLPPGAYYTSLMLENGQRFFGKLLIVR